MGLTVALLLAEILNVVQVFSPAQAVTVCYCCYCCSVVSKQKMPKNPGKTRKYLGFSRYFRVLPALDAGDRRGSLPGLPYCCSAGLTLATVVGEPHCCSVVTVNTSNTVQLPTLNSSMHGRRSIVRARAPAARCSQVSHIHIGLHRSEWTVRSCAPFWTTSSVLQRLFRPFKLFRFPGFSSLPQCARTAM